MNQSLPAALAAPAGWLHADQCRVADLDHLVQTPTDLQDYPQASALLHKVPVYDGTALRAAWAATPQPQHWRATLMAEWARAWMQGPGVLVVQGLYADTAVVDAATAEFQGLIEASRRAGHVRGLLRQPAARHGVRGLAGSGLPGHFADQLCQPGGRSAGGSP